MNLTQGQEVEFTYTDLKGQTKEVKGTVIPPSPNMPAEGFITVQTDRGPRNYDLNRIHSVPLGWATLEV